MATKGWTDADLKFKKLNVIGEPIVKISNRKPKQTHVEMILEVHEKKKHKYNAKKVIIDGIEFDSTLEGYMYSLLKLNGFIFNMQVVYIVQEKFVYGEEKIKKIFLKFDYEIIRDEKVFCIIDTKGMATPDWLVKVKVFKKNLCDEGRVIPLYIPRTQKDCRELVIKLMK